MGELFVERVFAWLKSKEWLGAQLYINVCVCVCACVSRAGGLLRPDYMFTVPQREWKGDGED